MARRAFRERADQLDRLLEQYVDAGGEVVEGGQRLKVSRYSKDKVRASGSSIWNLIAESAGAAGLDALHTTKGDLVKAMKKAGRTKEEQDAWLARWREQGLMHSEECTSLRWVKK